MRKIRELFDKYVPLWVLVSLSFALISAALFAITEWSRPFADFLHRTVGFALRVIMSFVSYAFPLSLFELLIIFAIPLIIFLTVLAVRRGGGRVGLVRFILSAIGIVAITFSFFIYALGIGYNTTPLADNLGITEDTDITDEELYETIVIVRDEINRLADKFDFSYDRSHMGYSLNTLSRKLVDSYGGIAKKYPFFSNFESRVKPIVFSSVMSDTGLTGIYTFYTGEANINIEYPDYCTVFTAAHELAHQRGIMPENEANFMAFLVCISSDDAYIRYSGYLNMFEYLASDLVAADRELYREVYAELDGNAKKDMRASTEVYKQHADSPLGDVVGGLNDGYLQMNGTDGVVSYDYVVRLAVGYYLGERK